MVVIAMTVEWSFLLMVSMAARTMWSMPHEGRTPSIPSTSCSGPTLEPSAWLSWPSQRPRPPCMVTLFHPGNLWSTTVSLSCALYGHTYRTILVFWMRSGLSWLCAVPKGYMRYVLYYCSAEPIIIETLQQRSSGQAYSYHRSTITAYSYQWSTLSVCRLQMHTSPSAMSNWSPKVLSAVSISNPGMPCTGW